MLKQELNRDPVKPCELNDVPSHRVDLPKFPSHQCVLVNAISVRVCMAIAHPSACLL